MKTLSIIVFILVSNLVFSLAKRDEYKLEQLQVIFRHGDRTPGETEILANDPHDEVYRSIGYGQLTKIGKEREFKIGQFLRKRYDDFLGEYKNDEVYAYSSDLDRTKMSLQLVLAGLYPPTLSTSLSKSVNWQPVPTHYEAWETGFLSAPLACPAYYKNFQETTKALRKSLLRKYETFLQHLVNVTGLTISNPFTTMIVHNNFRAALSLGLPLPLGCSMEDYHQLTRIMSITFKALTYNDKLRRMMARPMVERILRNLHENEVPKNIYLYSGHETNVAAFINAHNISGAPNIPDYGSAVILEKLKGPDQRSYVRVYLWTGVSEKLISLKFENCEKTCPLSEYEKIAQPILPNQASRVCTSPSTLCRRRTESAGKIDPDVQLSYFFAGSDLASFKYMTKFSAYVVEST